ncbi:hypothetical protein MBAV_002530 [Candidatus Magnetobacterium bavaricum]|uniref:Uncharacterized protein n=1 Tax=Candidatus Magnetobacterium bavaricum TaxID=29290 RepID=A0A0F3GTM9_9BACT|nr:hypothetical protein MBAV_002530 [Candidatus Magnetobacterium bavaricum]
MRRFIYLNNMPYLAENSRHSSLQIHKIQGHRGTEYREFYVDRFHSCIFKVYGNTYQLYNVGTHDIIDNV